jgi:hypothetical protein
MVAVICGMYIYCVACIPKDALDSEVRQIATTEVRKGPAICAKCKVAHRYMQVRDDEDTVLSI